MGVRRCILFPSELCAFVDRGWPHLQFRCLADVTGTSEGNWSRCQLDDQVQVTVSWSIEPWEVLKEAQPLVVLMEEKSALKQNSPHLPGFLPKGSLMKLIWTLCVSLSESGG